MMKRMFSIICIFSVCVHICAQTYNEMPTDIITDTSASVYEPMENILQTAPSDISPDDSLHLPSLNRYGQMRLCSYPTDMFGLYDWELHKGLNVNLGLSVFATFGKHTPKGAGFGQNISAMYATPLTSKLSLAIGGYFSNIYWTSNSYRDAGLNAILGYRFNEHWEAYLYGQKSMTDNRIPMPLRDMNNMGDRIGAAVRYNVNPSFSIQMSVSRSENNKPYFADFMRDVFFR